MEHASPRRLEEALRRISQGDEYWVTVVVHAEAAGHERTELGVHHEDFSGNFFSCDPCSWWNAQLNDCPESGGCPFIWVQPPGGGPYMFPWEIVRWSLEKLSSGLSSVGI